jgi:dCTP deaminase
MVLSDRAIREEIAKGRIIIDPLLPDCIQPASVDVHLDNKLLTFKPLKYPSYIDVRQSVEELMEEIDIPEDRPFLLEPGGFVLGSTLESITLPDDIVGRLEGKSSLARLGLLMHSTSGYVDPGWSGHLTIHLSNVAKLPVTLYYKMKIGQLCFLRLTSAVERLYGAEGLGSKYQGQVGPTASRYHRNFEEGKRC